MQSSPTNTEQFPILRLIAMLLLMAMMILFVYREAALGVLQSVMHREDSSHGLFVPALTAVFLWINRHTLRRQKVAYDWTGIPLIAIGVAIPLLKIGSFQIHFIAMVLSILGVIACLLGRAYLRHAAFPVLFLIAMTPLPDPLYEQIGDGLRTVNFWASLKVLDLFGVPYFRDGWLLQLPDSLLRVAVGCSGIRYLISYFVFATAYAYFFKASYRERVLVIALSIPIAFFASTLRLSSIFLLSYYISPILAEGWPHIFISWIVFFSVLMLSIWIDQRMAPDKAIDTLIHSKSQHTCN